ncbi:hypothetical protein NHF46_07790 [Arthrobacter alpinus]|nr:hypothetical protein [Arthrobacter alpinus]
MKADWVAASVRARSMAQRRIGAGSSRALAAEPTIAAALATLEQSCYAERLTGASTLPPPNAPFRRQFCGSCEFWPAGFQLRVPRSRAAAAATFEIENIVALAHQLTGGTIAPNHIGSGLSLPPGRVWGGPERSRTSPRCCAPHLGARSAMEVPGRSGPH